MTKAELIEALRDWTDETIILIIDHEDWACSIKNAVGQRKKTDHLNENEFYLYTANGRDEFRDSHGNMAETSHFRGLSR